jgi:fido (protein-threonine AMPylation protein)
VNLRDAFSLVREWAQDSQFSLTPFFLKQLHGLVTRGDDTAMPGLFRTGPVKIEQTSFVPPDALHVSELVEKMFQDIEAERFKCVAPLIQATEVHARFVSIHPFADGNGRIARLLANYFLWRVELPGILLPWENRDRYYDALEECNSGELINRGNLSDLGMLFCDLFEDVLMELEETVNSTTDVDTPIVEEQGAAVTRMTDLLSRLTKQKSALGFEAQYKKWVTAHETVLAGVRESIEDLSRGFNAAWGGRAEVLDFPIVERTHTERYAKGVVFLVLGSSESSSFYLRPLWI